MNKAKILRQCNEIERAVNELCVKRQVCSSCEQKYTGGCTDCVHPVDGSGYCLIAKMFDRHVNPEHGCSWKVPKKRRAIQTNGDRIRQMTDEELASEIRSSICEKVENCENDLDCYKCRMQWLRQEASEDA